jgi:hypothetical protein
MRDMSEWSYELRAMRRKLQAVSCTPMMKRQT